MTKFSDNSLVLASRGWGFHDLNMVMPYIIQCILCILFGYSLNMGISSVLIIVYNIPDFALRCLTQS